MVECSNPLVWSSYGADVTALRGTDTQNTSAAACESLTPNLTAISSFDCGRASDPVQDTALSAVEEKSRFAFGCL